MQALREFWSGGLPLGQAFWLWGVLGGAVVNLFATLLAAGLLAADLPGWLAAAVFAMPIPWNIGLAVGVCRSAQRPEVGRAAAFAAQIGILVWAAVLSMV